MSAEQIPEDAPAVVPIDVPDDRRIMDHKQQPKKRDRPKIPGRQANGYYADHHTGTRLRSVTTIIGGGVPKPALLFWAAKTVTDSAIENLPALVAASRFPDQLEAHRDWIKRAHTRKKDERAEVGSAVHMIIEARILGTPLPKSVQVGDEEWALDGEELKPYIDRFLAFERDWQPEWTASEMVVANPTLGYAGTLDYTIAARGPIGKALHDAGYAIDPDQDLMGDTKTGGEWITPKDGGEPRPRLTSMGHVHGVYPEAGLQMSAYRQAEVCWLRDGQRVAMPATNSTGIVLHIRPEGYRIYPARCGDREFRYFRHAQMIDEWSSRIASAKADDPVIGTALTNPTTEG